MQFNPTSNSTAKQYSIPSKSSLHLHRNFVVLVDFEQLQSVAFVVRMVLHMLGIVLLGVGIVLVDRHLVVGKHLGEGMLPWEDNLLVEDNPVEADKVLVVVDTVVVDKRLLGEEGMDFVLVEDTDFVLVAGMDFAVVDMGSRLGMVVAVQTP